MFCTESKGLVVEQAMMRTGGPSIGPARQLDAVEATL